MITPYPDVNTVLDRLLADVQAILGDHLVGMALYGSLSSGDFDPQRSDIDFVVITAGKLPDETITALEAMHMKLVTSGLKWSTKLEGSYMPLADLRRHDPTAGPYPQVNEFKFYVGFHGSEWILQRHTVRESGVVVAGPDLRPWIDPVSADDLRQAVMDILQSRWFLVLQDPAILRDSSFTILTLCRALYTLEYGSLASKPVCARWALENLGERWAGPIERALNWQPGDLDMRDEALALIEYVREHV
jgi:hypothetical protein